VAASLPLLPGGAEAVSANGAVLKSPVNCLKKLPTTNFVFVDYNNKKILKET
jgi:hypothetical protein